MRSLVLSTLLLGAALTCGDGLTVRRTLADESLPQKIDALIAARAGGPLSPRTDDAAFLRRIYLDLAGRIPTVAEAREFLADPAADKRDRLIDRLLASPDHAQRLADVLHVMLMERLGDAPEWRRYLVTAVSTNKPWDRLVREMIWADVADEGTRGAAFFFTKRLENYGQNPVDVPGLVRDVGRLFLGVDVQCAQCHDHLFVPEYTQDYYQGLFAFVGQAQIRRDVKFPALAETPLKKKVEFASVFTKEPRSVGPKLPGGAEIDIPVLPAGEEYETPPDRKTNAPGVLKFSPLKLLAEQLPTASNRAFARNMANRLWWLTMGRGLVQPLDLHHTENPPSHPELLELLASEFSNHQFDIRWLLSQLARTETYQRSSHLPADAPPEQVPVESYRTALEKPLSAEQLLAAIAQATEVAPREQSQTEAWEKLRERFAKAFANPPREPETEYAPSVRGALFLLNDEVILRWLADSPGNLIERLGKLEPAAPIADELYLAVLSRLPTDEERAEVQTTLERHSDRRPAALARLAWALLASTEFSVNH